MTIFEKIINREIHSNIIKETQHSIVIEDINPQAKIHYLLISKKKYENLSVFLNQASLEEKLDYFDLLNLMLQELKYAKIIFNCGQNAGQEIMHLHAHIMKN